ncbi:MAG: dipeptide epimerase [Candidatus Riflebacteria bacterium]|nr:dipeptide epimerase [Candidatus Riflebacteria bacterium]
MIITGIRTGILSIPLRKPFKTALRTVETVSTIVVAVDTDDGTIGFGEAPPTGPITGDSLGGIRGAIHEYIEPRLKGKEIRNLEDTLNSLERSCIKNTSAKSAVDIAIHDLFGKLYGIPLFRLFGGFRNKVETDLTISVNSQNEMVADSKEAVKRGFRILKVKVGLDPALDIKRIQSIREAVGETILIRVDANQGWTAKEAVRIMKKLESANLGIELLEQPVLAHDIEGLKKVKDSIETPVLADESVFSAIDAEHLINSKAADFLNIKLMKTGGLRSAQRICSIAELHGVECFMGCMMESKISVTAAVHLACAKSIITRSDLDSPSLCAKDPVIGGISIDGPWLTVPETPGLGIERIDGVVWD